jgi:hypothetical protein
LVTVLLACTGYRRGGVSTQIQLRNNTFRMKEIDMDTFSRLIARFGILGVGSFAVTAALLGLGAGTATADSETGSVTNAQSQADDARDATKVGGKAGLTSSPERAALPSLKPATGRVTVSTSVAALRVEKGLDDANRNLRSTMERLSAGNRINSAAR